MLRRRAMPTMWLNYAWSGEAGRKGLSAKSTSERASAAAALAKIHRRASGVALHYPLCAPNQPQHKSRLLSKMSRRRLRHQSSLALKYATAAGTGCHRARQTIFAARARSDALIGGSISRIDPPLF